MFYERLCILCNEKGCKPNTIAKSLHLSTATATKWKNGSIPNGETLKGIVDYLDRSVDYLLGRTDNPEINKQIVEYDIDEIVEKFKNLSYKSQDNFIKYMDLLLFKQKNENNKI